MIGAFPPDATDHPFDMAVLPRRAGRRNEITNAERLDDPLAAFAESTGTIPKKEFRHPPPRERFDELPPGPRACGSIRDVDVQNTAAVVR